jgi:hypothetical protein
LGTCTQQALKKCTICVFKPKSRFVPTNYTIQGSLEASMQHPINNFNLNIVTQFTTSKTLLHFKIVQLLKENAWFTKSSTSMQQRSRSTNQTIVPTQTRNNALVTNF